MDDPVPAVSGRFTVYPTPDGGYHVAYLADGEDPAATRHLEVPPMLVAIARKALADGTALP